MNNENAFIFGEENIGEQYASFSPDTLEGKMRLYNAINSPDKRLADYINQPIMLQDVVITKVTLSERKKRGDNDEMWIPEDTEKTRVGYRVIIIDKEGTSYTATSNGVYNSIKTLRNVFGDLHFEEGIQIFVKQISTKNGNTLTLSLK